MLLTRLGVFSYAAIYGQINFGFSTARIFAVGLLYDICTILYALPIFIIISILIPQKIRKLRPFNFSILFTTVYLLSFNAIAELLFWDEFGTRFNFIAVDYLVYTHEVVKNIYESYHIIPILLCIAIFATIITFLLMKNLNSTVQKPFIPLVLSTTLLIVTGFTISKDTFELKDHYGNELAHNGIYNLFAAFKNNTLSYQDFYKSIDIDDAFAAIKVKYNLKTTDRSTTHSVKYPQMHDYNVILITVESLSADFMTPFGGKENLTPFLDELAKDSILFTNYYATGTRTVRGLEALTLSLPPTPGNSILRRPNNENLFSLGSVLNENDYDLKFLYGGFGYFDNMNYFFANNHFKTIDRADLSKEEVNFANAWGVADEDIFQRAIKEADDSFSKKKKFMSFVMTTSNHRPFTYPENRIDIPSGSGRSGAVKYTDYALKTLIESARTKPWFDNTIFVITADHCAGSSGKTDLPIERYQIPLLIYAPKIIQPRKIDNLTSQIDVPPTILGLLGINHNSKFFGTDAINNPSNRAFISTYQKLGYLADSTLTILSPNFEHNIYSVENKTQPIPIFDDAHLRDGISFYQTAAYLYSNKLLGE